MIVEKIALEGFRSYDAAAFGFKDGVNIVWGENARGKTNLLESVMLLSGSGSWRTRKRGDLINFYKDRASIVGHVLARDRAFEIGIRMPLKGKNTFTVNDVAQKRVNTSGVSCSAPKISIWSRAARKNAAGSSTLRWGSCVHAMLPFWLSTINCAT